MPRPKTDYSFVVGFSVYPEHRELLDDLLERLEAAGAPMSRSRLVQFAIEQLAHNPAIRRVLAPLTLTDSETP